MVGSDRVEADIDERGGFHAEYSIDRARPGETIRVSATAYRQREGRDYMKIAGSWLQNQSPNNKPDRKVVGASVKLFVYQSHIRFELPRSADEYDFSTAQMVIRRADGSHTVVYEHRPPRIGFTRTHREEGGGWWIDYSPSGDEVNPTGTTEVEFSIYDLAGNRHFFKKTIETP